MNNDFAVNLIYLRGEKNLTQQELGDAVGVSPSQISRYESGSAVPRKTVMRKLAEVLGVSTEQLTQPDMVTLLIDEPENELWKIAIPRSLKDKVQAEANEFGVSVEVMFVAEFERVRSFWEGKEDLGIEHYLEVAKSYSDLVSKPSEDSNDDK